MGFYIRLAPGLKLRLTKRGARWAVGPRAARLHFGAGGTGVSTGAGPFSYYKGLGRKAPVFTHPGCPVRHRSRETMLKCRR